MTEVSKSINEKFSKLGERFEGMSRTPDEIGKPISTTAEKERNKNCETFAAKLKGIPISSDNTPILKDALKLAMAKKESEEARNLIVFNAPESKAETNEERKVKDSTFHQ